MADTPRYNPPLFGLNIDPSTKNLQLAYTLAQLADSAKLDFISIQDHPYNGNFFDTWTLLSFLGARTQHVRLLTNVVNLPLRPPAVLAKAVSTLDVLTNGRVELGLGAGGYWEGIVSYGGTQRTPGEAVVALEEAIAIMRTLWQPASPGEVVNFSGQFYQLVNAHPGPAPVHSIGIWLGALKPRMLRLTGERADGLLISANYIPPEEVPAVQQTIDEAARKVGRDPLAIRRGYNLMGAILQPGSHAMRARRRGVIVGTARQWIDEILRYYSDLKMDSFFFWPVMGDEEAQAKIFVDEVVPRVMAVIGSTSMTKE
jgi:alkanesulfonate monooxygenase SsuD/methylene tetrahydromethanopterin reductase-like flavin-dependent oxidoreductase (luciferase family)